MWPNVCKKADFIEITASFQTGGVLTGNRTRLKTVNLELPDVRVSLIHEAVGATDTTLTDANGCLLNSIWVSFHLDQKSSSCSESKQQNQEDPTFTSPVVKCTFSQEVYNGSDNRTNRGFVLNLSERFSLQRTVLGWGGPLSSSGSSRSVGGTWKIAVKRFHLDK